MSLPEPVRAELDRVTHAVLVDFAALEQVRRRFDDEQATALAGYLHAAQSPNTLRAYRSDWVAWAAWCQAEGRQALPADPVDVAVYLAVAADTTKDDGSPAFRPSTLERKAAAIAAVHAAGGLPSPTRSDVVRLTLRGIRRTRQAQPRRKRPVLLGTLEALLAERPPPGWPTGVARRRDALLLLVGFAGALRRSELAGLRLEDVTVDVDPRTQEPLLLVDLGVTKTDQTGAHRQRVVLPRGARRPTCPVCAFADWADVLTAADPRSLLQDEGDAQPTHRCHSYRPGPLSGPLFPSVSRYGRLGTRPVSDRAVSDLVKRYALKAGLDPALFGGHSLRAGFATQAALGGASDREIMRQGRWTNPRTVHRYIRTANPLEDNAVTRLGL
ncbi:site-specific integrase [Saccharothrix longispora]|uniref:site-specific integrase n=1 Tax=Saccharothrix longispora TaxID=33920 RepID=UPI0028FD3642|nr:site-specific integrase [Saccharothrix longispora]MBY8851040.1 site-specific integrase [Saccharothrix sp. MB29]MDU0294023.1 site-specific integrase [Saccharothrix longispora]